jgi:hypothetical protein
MANPQKRKGSQFERDVAEYMSHHGHPFVERAYGAGRPDDRGDLTGLPGWCLELKNHRSIDLAGWSNEAEAERVNGRCQHAAVIASRRGKPTAQSYVVMDLATFAAILAEDDPS